MKRNNRPPRKTKRELKAEAPRELSRGAQLEGAVRSVVFCSRVLHGHDLPGLISELEGLERSIRSGSLAGSVPNDQAERVRQDLETLRAGLPLWEHAKAVLGRLAVS